MRGAALPQAGDEVFDAVIVGGGPHATYALERLASAREANPTRGRLSIAILDRHGAFGCGAVHSDDQAATSYLNRAAADIALGIGEGPFPHFFAWQEAEAAAGRLDELLGRGDTPKRALHGRALRAAFATHAARLEALSGHVVRIRAEALAIADTGAGPCAPLRVDFDGDRRGSLLARSVLLATGHDRIAPDASDVALADFASARPGSTYLHEPYPLHAMDDAFEAAGARVALLGLGLSAIDVVLHLTEGRGGGFRRHADGRLEYRSSGREPDRIVAISPSGRTVLARPRNARAERGAPPHAAFVLSAEAVARLRSRRGRPASLPGGVTQLQLEFDRDVLPLVVTEMTCVHHRTGAPEAFSNALRAQLVPALTSFLDASPAEAPRSARRLLAVADQVARAEGSRRRFDAAALLAGSMPAGHGDWGARNRAAIAADLARARRGNLDDPVKAAIDATWRELRPVLNAALDFGGLTAGSEARFLRSHLRAYNRLSNGSAVEPMEKLLAIAEAGILDLSAGPDAAVQADPDLGRFRVVGPRTGYRAPADVVITARIRRFDPRRSQSPLYRSMLENRLVRLWENPGSDDEQTHSPGAIAIDAGNRAVGIDGRPDARLTLVGSPVDGVRYFQESLARPGIRGGVADVLDAWARTVAA